jgi:hypothetical protein
MIAFAAFNAGFDAARTRRLFRREVFDMCGYFARWDGERDQLLRTFSMYGLDLSSHFRKWSRGESFMYGIDHAKARPIHDIAHAFLVQQGLDISETDIIPADTIANGACYPIYPEIGEALGIKGSYMFKLPHTYKLISLEQFIELSFNAYRSCAPVAAVIDPGFLERYSVVSTAIAKADLS